MAYSWSKNVIKIDPTTYLLWALSALIIPAGWLCAWFAATTVHELGHYISLRFMDVDVSEVRINHSGILMRSRSMTHMQQAVCSLAGPFAGLILLPIMRRYPILAICLLFQSLFNLLPIYPLDGGVVIYELLAQIFGETVAWNSLHIISNILRLLVSIIILVIGVQLKSLLLFVVIVAIFLCKTGFVKFPCKPRKVIVQ